MSAGCLTASAKALPQTEVKAVPLDLGFLRHVAPSVKDSIVLGVHLSGDKDAINMFLCLDGKNGCSEDGMPSCLRSAYKSTLSLALEG